jgi:exopolysaccharide biosynthesis polyprenyl glycosylphosphotransferase
MNKEEPMNDHAQRRRQAALGALQTWDVAVFIACLAFAFIVTGIDAASVLTKTPLRSLVWLYSASLAWHLSLAFAQVYRSQRLSKSIPAREILLGASLGTSVVGALAAFPLDVGAVNSAVLVCVWALSVAGTVLSRVVLRGLLHRLRASGRNLRTAIVIGSGNRSLELLKSVEAAKAGYQWLGYIDDREEPKLTSAHGLRHLGPLQEIPAILAAHAVDEIFVTLPVRSCYDPIERAMLDCENQGISVKMPLDLFDSSKSVKSVDNLCGAPVLCYVPYSASTLYLFSKRVIDILVSASGLIVFAPLFLLVAILIKLDSAGPVFFLQQRVGLHKRLFTLFKFRTMRVGSEEVLAAVAHLNEADGPVFKIRNDPRVTAIGRTLRKTSIDELPQLLNVLLGDLSLVGPRPLPLRDVEGFCADWQRRRFSVKPGITCTWQISGRSALSFERWMELDMLYIQQRSLQVDLQILARTIPAVLTQRGAH